MFAEHDRPLIQSLATAAVILPAAIAAAGQQYEIINLNVLGGQCTSDAEAINSAGIIVGEGRFSCGEVTGTRWDGRRVLDLGLLLAEDTTSFALGLNNRGQIVGNSNWIEKIPITPDLIMLIPHDKAVIWDNGVISNLNSRISVGAGFELTYSWDINDAGQIVGVGRNPGPGPFHAFRFDNGVVTDLGTLGGSLGSYAFAINNAGQIVGKSESPLFPVGSGRDQAFLWQNGVMTDIDPHNFQSEAWDINERGQVTGYVQVSALAAENARAFLWENGQMHICPSMNPQLPQDIALAINNDGVMVGQTRLPFSLTAAMWIDGAVIDLFTLIPPGTLWQSLQVARGINDAGEIVGFGVYNGNPFTAFLMRPILTPGDLNGDGLVNTLDLGILLSGWSIPASAPGCGGSLPCHADINGDGFVNTLDLGILLIHWTL
jgi:probable HAF family extracellular repeat protein